MIHLVPCRNPCRLYIRLPFTYYVGPSSVVWSELGPAPPFPPMRVLAWSVMVTGLGFILNICSIKGKFWKREENSSLIILLSTPVVFSPKNISSKFYYNNNSLSWALAFFLSEHLFCLSHPKTCRTMLVDNVGLKICLLRIFSSV